MINQCDSANYILLPYPEKIVVTKWEDVVRADKTRDCLTVMQTIISFMKDHPDETFRSIEVRLRKERRFTYLVAEEKDKNLPANIKVLDLKRNECPYQLFVTTRNKNLALAEKDKLVPNYQLNLERLEKTGAKQAIPKDYLKYFATVGGELEVNSQFLRELQVGRFN